jgi:hypothetical protein
VNSRKRSLNFNYFFSLLSGICALWKKYTETEGFTLLIRIIYINFAGIKPEFKSDLLKWDYSIS